MTDAGSFMLIMVVLAIVSCANQPRLASSLARSAMQTLEAGPPTFHLFLIVLDGSDSMKDDVDQVFDAIDGLASAAESASIDWGVALIPVEFLVGDTLSGFLATNGGEVLATNRYEALELVGRFGDSLDYGSPHGEDLLRALSSVASGEFSGPAMIDTMDSSSLSLVVVTDEDDTSGPGWTGERVRETFGHFSEASRFYEASAWLARETSAPVLSSWVAEEDGYTLELDMGSGIGSHVVDRVQERDRERVCLFLLDRPARVGTAVVVGQSGDALISRLRGDGITLEVACQEVERAGTTMVTYEIQ